MIKSELVKRISAQNRHLFERDIEKIVNAILDEMIDALRRGDRVELRGFGAFSVKLREARQGRNPRTGAVVAVGKKAIPAFKTGKEMRERLNRVIVPSTETIPSDERANKSAVFAHDRRFGHLYQRPPKLVLSNALKKATHG